MLFDNSSFAWPNEFLRASAFLMMYLKFGTWNEFKIPSLILTSTFSVSLIISLVAMSASLMRRTKVEKIQ